MGRLAAQARTGVHRRTTLTAVADGWPPVRWRGWRFALLMRCTCQTEFTHVENDGRYRTWMAAGSRLAPTCEGPRLAQDQPHPTQRGTTQTRNEQPRHRAAGANRSSVPSCDAPAARAECHPGPEP